MSFAQFIPDTIEIQSRLDGACQSVEAAVV
jgi:hypothetical protein